MDTSAGVTFGQTATYSCDFGYTLFGNETRQCTSQGWDGAQPVCELVGTFCYKSMVRQQKENSGLHQSFALFKIYGL